MPSHTSHTMLSSPFPSLSIRRIKTIPDNAIKKPIILRNMKPIPVVCPSNRQSKILIKTNPYPVYESTIKAVKNMERCHKWDNSKSLQCQRDS